MTKHVVACAFVEGQRRAASKQEQRPAHLPTPRKSPTKAGLGEGPANQRPSSSKGPFAKRLGPQPPQSGTHRTVKTRYSFTAVEKDCDGETPAPRSDGDSYVSLHAVMPGSNREQDGCSSMPDLVRKTGTEQGEGVPGDAVVRNPARGASCQSGDGDTKPPGKRAVPDLDETGRGRRLKRVRFSPQLEGQLDPEYGSREREHAGIADGDEIDRTPMGPPRSTAAAEAPDVGDFPRPANSDADQ